MIRGGEIRFVYHHYLTHGSPSVFSAIATECGGDQEAWWEFHDHFMATSDFSRAAAISVAESFSLDTARFAECIDSQRYLDYVTDQHREAEERGATPALYVEISMEGGAVISDALLEQVEDLLNRGQEQAQRKQTDDAER